MRDTPFPPPPALSTWERPRKSAATIAAGIALDSVTRNFDGRLAVDNVSLDMAAGEIVCVLGPSGCGKTTMLRLIAGLEVPDAGRVLIGGAEVAGPARFTAPEKRGVGLMFQDFALFPHLTIAGNVAFGLTRLGRAQARHEALAALARIGLEDYADAYPHMLSGGQQQRVALARAIAPRPAVLLMDEPFSGLDPRLRQTIREETLHILREARATALIVTHDAEEAMRLGDRIAVMRGGRLVQIGRPEELYRAPADVYIAETFSEVNAVPCRIVAGYVVTPFGAIAAAGLADGPGICCLRQHGLRLGEGGCTARVTRIKFLGGEALVELMVPGIARELIARAPAHGLPGTGTEVSVRLDPAAVMVFADG